MVWLSSSFIGTNCLDRIEEVPNWHREQILHRLEQSVEEEWKYSNQERLWSAWPVATSSS